jgi:hypothetical protein
MYLFGKTPNGFEARKAPGQSLDHLPGRCRELEASETGRAFDVGLLLLQIQEEAKEGDWDLVGENETNEEFVIIERPKE